MEDVIFLRFSEKPSTERNEKQKRRGCVYLRGGEFTLQGTLEERGTICEDQV